jgi:hypothetical protein
MSRKWIVRGALFAILVLPAVARAHEGHVHKIMGTVTVRHDNQFEVKTTDGKTVTILMNGKTSVLRGKSKVDLTAVKPGERVVVDIGDGKEPVTAREIKLGEAAGNANTR